MSKILSGNDKHKDAIVATVSIVGKGYPRKCPCCGSALCAWTFLQTPDTVAGLEAYVNRHTITPLFKVGHEARITCTTCGITSRAAFIGVRFNADDSLSLIDESTKLLLEWNKEDHDHD